MVIHTDIFSHRINQVNKYKQRHIQRCLCKTTDHIGLSSFTAQTFHYFSRISPLIQNFREDIETDVSLEERWNCIAILASSQTRVHNSEKRKCLYLNNLMQQYSYFRFIENYSTTTYFTERQVESHNPPNKYCKVYKRIGRQEWIHREKAHFRSVLPFSAYHTYTTTKTSGKN
jgi:hypothetical protein